MELKEAGDKDLLKRARYLGQDQEDDGLPWMEHLEKSQEGDPGVSRALEVLAPAVPEHIEHKEESSALADGGKSLIEDIKDPRSLAREQGSPAVRQDVEDLQSGSVPITHFLSPEMYGEGSSLKYKWDSRERTDTATGTAFGQEYTGLPVEASLQLFMVPAAEAAKMAAEDMDKVAVSLPQIIASNRHPRKEKTIRNSMTISASLISTEDQLNSGLLVFDMQSKGSDVSRRTVIQFLRSPNGPGGKSLMEHDCLVGCSCPAFLWWGPLYYATSGRYLFNVSKKEIIGSPDSPDMKGVMSVPGSLYDGASADASVAPTKRGPGYTFCKHIYKAYQSASRWSFKIDVNRLSGVKERVDDEDTEQLREEFHLDGTGSDSFENFIGKSTPSKELKDLVDSVMKDHASDAKRLDDYIVRRWNALIATGKSKDIETLVKVMDQWATAPHIMLYVLQRGREMLRQNRAYRNFMIPRQIVQKAKSIIERWVEQN